MDEQVKARPPEIRPRNNKNSVIPSYFLSHGTLCVFDLEKTRKFYEEFLGLEVVRHNSAAMCFRLNTDMRIVCVRVKKVPPMEVMSHWGLDVENKQDVDAAHAAAVASKEKYGIQKITRPVLQHGNYAFLIQDRDNNWWEIQHTPLEQTNFFFDRGDRPDLAP
ncbi:MAG: VOC family protein [Pseudomonadota bacterium]|nr:VOC family protein [Pseudomonadota bacterium]